MTGAAGRFGLDDYTLHVKRFIERLGEGLHVVSVCQPCVPALAAVGFAKAARRRQIMVATSSIGPGATNMVTAAGVAHANRLPVLLLSGDTFASRLPDPVLQQVEHWGDPTLSVNDAFKPVVRYWDRITRPEQILQSLPQALGMMLTSRRVPASEGLRLGFVNEVVPADQLEAAVERWCAEILAASPMSIRASKEAVYRGLDETSLADALKHQGEYPAYAAWRQSEAAQEGPRAFAEKRKPAFKNR